jgi:hypothetical protein
MFIYEDQLLCQLNLNAKNFSSNWKDILLGPTGHKVCRGFPLSRIHTLAVISAQSPEFILSQWAHYYDNFKYL